MKEYRVPIEVTLNADIESTTWPPLAKTIHRFISIKDRLKALGMAFRLTPNSFFHSDLPVKKTHHYFDCKTMCDVYIERDNYEK